jgi:putative phosphoesterase
MLVGLISDTHGLLRPEVFAAFEGVGHILHAGDVGDPDILTELATIAPVTAVWGNTDEWDLRARLPAIARIELAGLAVTVLHGHQHGMPTAAALAQAYSDAGLVVFGHSHKPEMYRTGGTLAVNPGSAGPVRFKLPVTVAMARLGEGDVEAELISLVP